MALKLQCCVTCVLFMTVTIVQPYTLAFSADGNSNAEEVNDRYTETCLVDPSLCMYAIIQFGDKCK